MMMKLKLSLVGLLAVASICTLQAQTEDIRLAKDLKFTEAKQNLGGGVNSSYAEKIPIIAPDGQTLYFSRSGHPKNVGKKDDEDTWKSIYKDGSWQDAAHLPKPINTKVFDAVMGVLADNRTLVLSNAYNAKGKPKEQGISFTTRTEKGWSRPRNAEVKDFYHQTSNPWGASISSDGQTLLFSLERPDALGLNDMYVSFLQKDSTWSAPLHLGNVINTKGFEGVPFLAADNETIYFASNGHPGYGGMDLFVSKRLDETWSNWSAPYNLGDYINTPNHESRFVIPASGDYGYFSSSDNSIGEDDIFRIKMPEQVQPNPVMLLSGTVRDRETQQPLAAQLYFEVRGGKTQKEYQSQPDDGHYATTLPAGKAYEVRISAPKYTALDTVIDLRETELFEAFTADFSLLPLRETPVAQVEKPTPPPVEEVNLDKDTLTFSSLEIPLFKFDRDEISPEFHEKLDRVAVFLKEQPNIELEVAGHTDNVGSAAYNLQLSARRAKAVRAYLVEQGIADTRLTAKGYGLKNPRVPNTNKSNRAQNRRVEFIVRKR